MIILDTTTAAATSNPNDKLWKKVGERKYLCFCRNEQGGPCKTLLSSKSGMKGHISSHSVAQGKIAMESCPVIVGTPGAVCGKTFAYKTDFFGHLRCDHLCKPDLSPLDKTYDCDKCDYKGPYPTSLATHRFVHHMSKEQKKKLKLQRLNGIKFECQFSAKKFDSKYSRNRHELKYCNNNKNNNNKNKNLKQHRRSGK